MSGSGPRVLGYGRREVGRAWPVVALGVASLGVAAAEAVQHWRQAPGLWYLVSNLERIRAAQGGAAPASFTYTINWPWAWSPLRVTLQAAAVRNLPSTGAVWASAAVAAADVALTAVLAVAGFMAVRGSRHGLRWHRGYAVAGLALAVMWWAAAHAQSRSQLTPGSGGMTFRYDLWGMSLTTRSPVHELAALAGRCAYPLIVLAVVWPPRVRGYVAAGTGAENSVGAGGGRG